MDLVLVRHAISQDRDAVLWPNDDFRPLTPAGRDQFRQVARGLKRLEAKVSVVLTSPLVRATETAKILEEEAKWPGAHVCDNLKPGHSTQEMMGTLADQSGVVVVVGHEPDLSILTGMLIGVAPNSVGFHFKKGGAASIRFDSEVAAGTGVLRWFATPKMLKALD